MIVCLDDDFKDLRITRILEKGLVKLRITGFVTLPFSLVCAVGPGEVLVNDLPLSVSLDINMCTATLNGFFLLPVFKVHRPVEGEYGGVSEELDARVGCGVLHLWTLRKVILEGFAELTQACQPHVLGR